MDDILSNVISSILDCICLDIDPSSTSPILAVPAIVLNPSGAKNITSPPISWILPPSLQPMFLVTSCTANEALAVPVNLYILSSQNIINSFLNTFNPTTAESTLNDPAPLPVVKLSSSKATLNITSCELVAPA